MEKNEFECLRKLTIGWGEDGGVSHRSWISYECVRIKSVRTPNGSVLGMSEMYNKTIQGFINE